jgi:hypothetical protein
MWRAPPSARVRALLFVQDGRLRSQWKAMTRTLATLRAQDDRGGVG